MAYSLDYSPYVGVVCSRAGSKRLINKNKLKIDGKPMAIRAIDKLSNAIGSKNVYHLTDIEDFLGNSNTVKRPPMLNGDHTPLQDVVKWFIRPAYFSNALMRQEAVIIMMPTNPFLNEKEIKRAIKLYESGEFNIVRSYDSDGKENGLYIISLTFLMRHQTMGEIKDYDTYTGAIFLKGKEIHTSEEYDYARSKLG